MIAGRSTMLAANILIITLNANYAVG
jgi:hypothetical protein